MEHFNVSEQLPLVENNYKILLQSHTAREDATCVQILSWVKTHHSNHWPRAHVLDEAIEEWFALQVNVVLFQVLF